MAEWMRAYGAAVGAVSAAAASALCCAAPVVAASLGVSGAGLAARFEPLRPYLLMGTASLLLLGFSALRREERWACEPGRPCARPEVRARMRTILWAATGAALLLATFPSWQALVP
ncbi:MAG: mercuric transporter MerT family protein [Gemmatimonadales bacterium]